MSYVPATPEHHHHGSHWNASLCGCFDDCESCLCSYFCPCIQFGRNVEAAGLGDCCSQGFCYFILAGLGVHWILGCLKRGEIRNKFGIEGNGCEDCMCHLFCTCCVLSQEAREIRLRGHLLHK